MRLIESKVTKAIKRLKVTAYYTGESGTYASVMPTTQSSVYLKACCDIARDLGFDGATSPFDMHVTVIHSKKGLSLAEQNAAWNSGYFGVNQEFAAKPKHFTHWAGHDETGYLVLELDSPELAKINSWLRSNFDLPVSFDEYKAHLTIVTDAYTKGGTEMAEKLIAELNKIPMPDEMTFQGLRIEPQVMLVLNHNHTLHRADDLGAYPNYVSQEHRVALSKFDHILWVQHPVSGVTWPWLVDQYEYNFLRRIDQGIETLTPAEQRRGVDMGILIEADTVLAERETFVRSLIECRKQLATDGYCKIPTLTFPTYWVTVNYYLQKIDADLVFDNQVVGRRSMHNAALFRAVHSQIATLVQSVVDEAIKPSYCYLSVYPQGSELVKHTDRAQCKWNASIAFARTDDLWPIYVEVPSGVKEIRAELGEVVVYRGTDIPHWREPLPAGTATVCFFHFVKQPYQGTLR